MGIIIFQMKSVLICLAFTAIAFGNIVLPNQDLEAEVHGLQFLEGFVEGLGTHVNLQDVSSCLSIDQEVVLAVHDVITQLHRHTADATTKALQDLTAIVSLVPRAIQECKAGLNELDGILKTLENIRNPASFFYKAYVSIKVNGVEISKEIDAGIAAWGNQAYRQSGQNFGAAFAEVFLQTETVTSEEYATRLNSVDKLWTATNYPQFENMTLKQFKNTRLGTYVKRNAFLPNGDVATVGDLPTNFDARQQWPNCVHPIRDQQRCGSCWAFGASEALSDRFCIASKGDTNVVLSPQYLVSCDRTDMGCNGGYLDHAWTFLENSGTVSDSCWSYHSGDGTVPDCRVFKACEDGQPIKNYYVKRGSSRALTNPASIKTEVLANGPVETGFRVYQDFMSYKTGIYHHTSGSLLGGHAVKIVGWGQDSGTNYWIVANSWNTNWGEQGFFRIREGDCGFDQDGIAGTPDLSRQ
eukprot:TRINITY_DN83_c0_g3_i2.p1 TRINITY_DN83_c0_g3~~TRINITY_DN83_c0_g3_i2.p1  ORF type:complete len:468 (-),score=121.15 TRINITY_DN83_c0_g3_i2:131-1534(-)